jgi:23S rRNA pseudouridine2605 synthase
MRINKFLASATGMSRRAADRIILEGRVKVNDLPATSGHQITDTDIVLLDDRAVVRALEISTILLNKPVGYVCSRNGQGSRTIYELIPHELHHLKPVGRLDKDSSGLLLMTNNGNLAHELTHPSKQKIKLYEVTLSKALAPLHRQMISDYGVMLDDGPSKLQLDRLRDGDENRWQITMHEGRNRQIRRSFESLGYKIIRLHRIRFGNYALRNLTSGSYEKLADDALK